MSKKFRDEHINQINLTINLLIDVFIKTDVKWKNTRPRSSATWKKKKGYKCNLTHFDGFQLEVSTILIVLFIE